MSQTQQSELMTQLLPWVQNSPVIAIIILIGLILLIRMLILKVLSKKALFYYGFLFPGVVLHEISHFIGCLIVGARVKKMSLFNSQGGYVIHEQSGLPIIGDLIISIFPLLVGMTLIYFLIRYYLGNILDIHFTISQVGKITIILYLGISIVISMLPSWQDFINASYGYIILLSIIVILEARFGVFKQQLFSIAILMGAAVAVLCVFLIVSYLASFLRFRN